MCIDLNGRQDEIMDIPKKFTAMLVYGRPPLVFGAMICAIGVMWFSNPAFYLAGVIFLVISMSFDLIDGWFSARFQPNPLLAHLADRVMDKVVYSIVFPLVAVGMMWRLLVFTPTPTRGQLLHALFVLILCVTVLIRDNFAHFMRGFALRRDLDLESSDLTRIRTVVAAPVGVLLYAVAFYVPSQSNSYLYDWLSLVNIIPLRDLFFIEIVFLIINFGSIAGYCRKYGTLCLDEVCMEDDRLRRKILAVFPNSLTVMNAMMGLLAVFFAYQGRIREAYLFLVGAAIFDKLDGALARKLGLVETGLTTGITLGGILDDVSDAVSFCIVPAWIFYLVFADAADPFLAHFPAKGIAVLYALMGVCRLIFFTLDRSPIPGFFKGMPTPAAALLVVAPLIMLHQARSSGEWLQFWEFFSAGSMLLAAVLMNVYALHYLHMGRFVDRRPWFGRLNLLLLVISIFTPYFGYVALTFMILYTLSPIWTRRMEPKS